MPPSPLLEELGRREAAVAVGDKVEHSPALGSQTQVRREAQAPILGTRIFRLGHAKMIMILTFVKRETAAARRWSE